MRSLKSVFRLDEVGAVDVVHVGVSRYTELLVIYHGEGFLRISVVGYI